MNQQVQLSERELHQRGVELNNQISRMEAQKEMVFNQLQQKQQEAIALFGTCDIEQLKEIYRRMNEQKKQNLISLQSKLLQGEQVLGTIRSNLNQIEQKR